ncbi:hypothetical protein OLX02_01585 [Novosphingobium sp. KCTC 2891]|uniref:hypothetical protein n=1 Tax=Novosphingobium sp. KCTC 2891 TaxID=2989730 RepID=UPI0022223ACC|nr:hypothetical protein [Novosphingobium sp. KCTC 2891]MCW1381506.1 hypothetical protein [Novosphingobium sp. KCTC 2891]
MAKRSVIALCKITTSDPDAQMEFSGQYDEQGNPVLKKQMYSILAGSLFQMDEGDPDFLPFIENEVIRLATDLEIQHGRAID